MYVLYIYVFIFRMKMICASMQNMHEMINDICNTCYLCINVDLSLWASHCLNKAYHCLYAERTIYINFQDKNLNIPFDPRDFVPF